MFNDQVFLGVLDDEPVRQPRPSTEHLPLAEQLAEERWFSWLLAEALREVASLAQAAGYDGGVVARALALVKEHPITQAQDQAVADFMDGHPELRHAGSTAGIMQVAEERLQRSGYVLPEGMHITDV